MQSASTTKDAFIDFLTIKEFSETIDRSTKTVRRYILNKTITKVIKTPTLYLIHKDEIHNVYKPLY